MKQPATVSPQGENRRRKIDGVITERRPVHPDHRGRLYEIYRGVDDGVFSEPIVWAYAWSIRSGKIKGWGRHEQTIDRYALISGEVSVVLFDGREGSPTRNLVQVVHLSHQDTQLLLIPTGVWHLTTNHSAEEAYLMNFKTKPFNHEEPDKEILPWDSPEIPFDIAKFVSGANLRAL